MDCEFYCVNRDEGGECETVQGECIGDLCENWEICENCARAEECIESGRGNT